MSNPKGGAFYLRVVERANELALQLKVGGPEYTCYTNNGDTSLWSVVKRSGSSKRDTVYIVDLAADTCECPCWVENGYCKHGIALNLMLDAIAQEESLAEQCERAEREQQDCKVWEMGTDPFAHI